MSSKEQYPPKIFDKKLVINSTLLLTCPSCPPNLTRSLENQIMQSNLDWITQSAVRSPSRRKVYIHKSDFPIGIVVKKKEEVIDPNNAQMKIRYFTQSVIHEFRASYFLYQLLSKINSPKLLEHNGDTYSLHFKAQKPLAAIINLADPTERYTIFEYIDGISIRDDVRANGGWNYTDEEKRRLYGKFHVILSHISNELIENHLEPWDLGIHQVIYQIIGNQITLSIIDAEEYNFSDQYGEHWPDTFKKFGLPPVLAFIR